MNKHVRLLAALVLSLLFSSSFAQIDVKIINKKNSLQTFQQARKKISNILNAKSKNHYQNNDAVIESLINQLENIPYGQEASGEGDWQSNALNYVPNAIHLKQDPVYRLDHLNCQTFVQMVMSLYNSTCFADFDKTYLQIAYGAAGNPQGEVVHFFNRNHFVEGDFNPINQHNLFLQDISDEAFYHSFLQTATVSITRQNWFVNQLTKKQALHLFSKQNAKRMQERIISFYYQLNFPHFNQQTININYFPKKVLFHAENGQLKMNHDLIEHWPTPAIVEIVNDKTKWPTKKLFGSELLISHFGILYHHTFDYGQLIFHAIHCQFQQCQVTPVYCLQTKCSELMFAHATDVYPDNFYWYKNSNGNYVCQPIGSKTKPPFPTCNRVEKLPLWAYLFDYQNGVYRFINNRRILGLHVEKLLPKIG